MFDDCKILAMPQRFPEWFQARKGLLTASEFGEWLVEPSKIRLTIEQIKLELDSAGIDYKKSSPRPVLLGKLPNAEDYLEYTQKTQDARHSAVCKALAEAAGCWFPDDFESQVMRRGRDLEPEAVDSFQNDTGLSVIPAGFCRSIHGAFGCSPDGLTTIAKRGWRARRRWRPLIASISSREICLSNTACRFTGAWR